MNSNGFKTFSNSFRRFSTITICNIRSIWCSKLEIMTKIHFGSFKNSQNPGRLNSWTTKAVWLIFSGEVVLKHLFQYLKYHFGQTFTFWAMVHSIWPKNPVSCVNRGHSPLIISWTKVFPDMRFLQGVQKRTQLSEYWIGFPRKFLVL